MAGGPASICSSEGLRPQTPQIFLGGPAPQTPRRSDDIKKKQIASRLSFYYGIFFFKPGGRAGGRTAGNLPKASQKPSPNLPKTSRKPAEHLPKTFRKPAENLLKTSKTWRNISHYFALFRTISHYFALFRTFRTISHYFALFRIIWGVA